MSLNINEIISELYKSKPISFIKSYGVHLGISILIILLFLVIIGNFQFKNAIPDIKKNWNKNRCNPLYMPFAGLVSKNKGESAFEATGKNFEGCTNNILQTIADDALAPIHYSVSLISDAVKGIEDAFNSIRAMIDKARSSVGDIGSDMSGRTLNIMIPLQKMFINAKDFLGKVKGVFTTGVFTLIGSYLITKSVLFNIINLVIVTILLILVASIAAYLFIPFVGEALAAPLIAIFTAIAVLLLPVIIFFDNKMGGDTSDVLPHW